MTQRIVVIMVIMVKARSRQSAYRCLVVLTHGSLLGNHEGEAREGKGREGKGRSGVERSGAERRGEEGRRRGERRGREEDREEVWWGLLVFLIFMALPSTRNNWY